MEGEGRDSQEPGEKVEVMSPLRIWWYIEMRNQDKYIS